MQTDHAPDRAKDAARTAAEAWLVHIDRGDPEASWAEAASGFRSAISSADWATSIARVQEALGRPLEREFTSAEYHSELPGAPDGHYVVLKFATRFERKEHGIETVVPALDTDGVWRVSGYFVR